MRSCYLDVELPHHPHVLVLDVVAVEHIAAADRPRNRVELRRERQKDPHIPDVRADEDRVLAPLLERRGGGLVAREKEETRQGKVHRGGPPPPPCEGAGLPGPPR